MTIVMKYILIINEDIINVWMIMNNIIEMTRPILIYESNGEILLLLIDVKMKTMRRRPIINERRYYWNDRY